MKPPKCEDLPLLRENFRRKMVKTVLIAGLARVQLGLMPRCNSVPVSNYAIHILNAPFTLWSHSTFNECHSREAKSQPYLLIKLTKALGMPYPYKPEGFRQFKISNVQ